MIRAYIRFMAFSAVLMSAMPAFAENVEHAAEGGKKILPALDVALYPGVLFWSAVTFLTLLVIMQKVAVPAVQKTLGNRQEMLERDLGQARKMGEHAQDTVKTYEAGLHKARMNANETVGNIVAAAEKEAAEQLAEQAKDIKHRVDVAHDNIITAKEDAIKDAMPLITELVQDVHAQVLQSGLTPQATSARK